MWTPSTSKHRTNDRDIRAVLVSRLEKRFPSGEHNLIVQEFGCDSARVDIAVVNGALHGYEIKSDQDTAIRLSTQVPAYGQVFDHMTLVIGGKHKPTVIDHIPEWWAIMVAKFQKRGVTLKVVRKGKPNPSQSNAAIARLLWSSEAASILRRHGHTVPHFFRADDIWNSLTEKLEPKELSLEVRNTLRTRAKLKAGSPQTLRGDSYTTESNALQLRRSENRRWLALQSVRHQS